MLSINIKKNKSHFDNMHVCGKGQPQGIAPTGCCHHNHRLINDNIIKKNDRSNDCKKHPLCFGDINVGAGLAPALFQKLIIKQQLGL